MQLARLNILEAESRQEWPNAIQSCRRAIALDSEGKQADMLYLKLGELLYKNGDFHEAQLVLQPFPSKYPDSPLQAAALFLAGKAAQQSNTGSTLNAALNIFKTLGTGDTPFAQPARIEEASVLLRMGKADQCIAALENLLSSPLPRYMRLLALSIQADAWVAKEDTHSDTLCKAINLCTEILDTPNLGLAWKFKALTQRAQFYERMNEQKKALDDYASILPTNAGTGTGSTTPASPPSACWASFRTGTEPWHWQKNWRRLPAPEPGKQRLTRAASSWNISFGRMNRKPPRRKTESRQHRIKLRIKKPFLLPWIPPPQQKTGDSTQQPSSWTLKAVYCWARTAAATRTGTFRREASLNAKALNRLLRGRYGRKWACAPRNTPLSAACPACVTNTLPTTVKLRAG